MRNPEWGDHFEHRLVLIRLPDCKGTPAYTGGTDQTAFCAGGCIAFSEPGDGDNFHLPVGKLAEFVATLYEAAGKPESIILERPGQTIQEVVVMPGARFRIQGNSIEAAPLNGPGVKPDSFSPAAIRDIAAALAVMADAAENEPDPAEVQSLADEMYSDVRRIGGSPPEEWRIAARAALRWMKQQEEAAS